MATASGPYYIVNDKYQRSIGYADAALAATTSFQQALNLSIYQPPVFDLKWQAVAPPALTTIPGVPTIAPVAFQLPSGKPSALNAQAVDVEIDDFAIAPPVLNFGQAPTMNFGQAPSLPALRDVPIPDAPDVVLPDAPVFLALQTHNFGGVDLHEGWLTKLDEIPELSVLEPAPFQYRPGVRYASQLMDNLKAVLNARIQSGTGILPAVEQQIWDRARDRETQVALAREQEVLRGAEALGFPLPSGVLAAQLADARREYHDKLSGLSRDIAIKQADLEQANLKDAIQQALALEGTLLDDTYKLEMLAFEAAKTAADNGIAAHNAALEQFKVLLDGYRAYAAAYETVVKAEMNKVDVFKAMLQAEQIKADINQSLVARYKAEIEGRMAAVEIYKARLGAAQTMVELERARIQAGGEQVRAFVATVNAETAKAEMYKANIGAESAKVEAYRALTQAYSAKVGAQGERARAEASKFQAKVSAKQMEWDGWKAEVAAETARMETAAKQASITVDGYRAATSAAEAQAGANMRLWEANIRQYEAGMQIALQTGKATADAVMHTNNARLEAAKVGLATNSQRLASAWAMVSASASVSGSDSSTV